MKKLLMVASLLLISAVMAFAGAASESTQDEHVIDNLIVYYVPSRDPGEIITQTAPLKNLLTEALAEEGYTVNDVTIQVGTTYEAVGVALSTGAADVGLIPANTYILYDDGCDVILTATRDGLSVESDDPVDWNSNEPITASDEQVVGYRALIIAGPSAKGRELAARVNSGESLTWDDLNSAAWAVMSSTSPAGYVYPSIWMMENYDGKTIADLQNTVVADSYASAFARLASGQVDVLVTYADARRDYEGQWTDSFGRSSDIWTDTDVIGVTPMIYNDTVSVSKFSDKMTPEFINALQNAFMSLSETEEGRQVIAIYSHTGYQRAQSSDYDNERLAQQMIQEASN